MHLFTTITDEDAAISSRKSFATLDTAQTRARQQIDTIVLSDDPFVDVKRLFALYNVLYFRSLLIPRVSIVWDPVLIHCSGTCELTKDEEGKHDQVLIKLSEPVLRFRPRTDVINTVLHESIHAYFFIATRWRHTRADDPGGHGKGFTLLASSINTHGGYHVNGLHNYVDEVDSYRSHMWQCKGACANKAPFYGIVKRATDLRPSAEDAWYTRHRKECGGHWKKLAVPDMTKAQVEQRFIKLAARRRNSEAGSIATSSSSRRGSTWDEEVPIRFASISFSDTTTARHDSISSTGSSMAGPLAFRRESAASASAARKGSSQSLTGVVFVGGVDTSVTCCPICHIKIFTQAFKSHVDRQHSEYSR